MTDRIVIGGFGPAGASLALALVQAGIAPGDITIFDPDIAPRAADPADMRILALNSGTRRFLAVLGIWDALAPDAHPMRRIAISDSALEARFRPVLLGFDAEGDEPLAHLVPLGRIQERLRQACRDVGIMLVAGRFSRFTETAEAIETELGSHRLRSALLVAGDGALSRIRVAAGIPMHGWGYDQSAIVATTRHSGTHEGEAVQHFLPSGPFAMLPLDEGRSSIVWSEKTAFARAVAGMGREDQAREIGVRAAGWRGEIRAVEGLSTHPLQLGLARRFHKGRIALLADAAHVVHPLAGQGLNLGFEDAATLAEIIIDRLRLGLDPGAPDALESYQSRRRPAAVAMAAVTDGINRLFSNDLGPLRLIRDVGVGIVGRVPGFVAGAMRFAAGGGLQPPRLFRGEPL